MEEWRPVVGFEGLYEVSDLGRVRSLHVNRLIARSPHPGGYVLAHLYRDGQRFARTYHRLVLEAFVGPRPAGMEALHGNHIRDDNRLYNLRWGTKRENEDDKVRSGNVRRGERSPVAKLTAADVHAIRRRTGEPQLDLAEEFGCTFSNISAIQLRKSWRHV